jgi:hypothetical protein
MTMTAAVLAPPTAVSRVAPSGAPVELTVPAAFGEFRWYATARFSGPHLARQFFLAPAREHRVVPTHVMPGAREHRVSMRGFDAVVFEAADRSDATLVLVGPYHEATTWFGGPAPNPAGLTAMLDTFRFTDSPQGATLVPVSDLLVKQSDVTLIGRGPSSTLVVRRSVDLLAALPEWAGMRLPGGELWRARRLLGEDQQSLVAGTPHEWRFLLGSETAVMDLVFRGPESGRPALEMSENELVEALGQLSAKWVQA